MSNVIFLRFRHVSQFESVKVSLCNGFYAVIFLPWSSYAFVFCHSIAFFFPGHTQAYILRCCRPLMVCLCAFECAKYFKGNENVIVLISFCWFLRQFLYFFLPFFLFQFFSLLHAIFHTNSGIKFWFYIFSIWFCNFSISSSSSFFWCSLLLVIRCSHRSLFIFLWCRLVFLVVKVEVDGSLHEPSIKC